MSGFIICGDVAEGGTYYYISYGSRVDGYRHAYRRTVGSLGRSEIKLTRNPRHPADPKCPGCAERRCRTCGILAYPGAWWECDHMKAVTP